MNPEKQQMNLPQLERVTSTSTVTVTSAVATPSVQMKNVILPQIVSPQIVSHTDNLPWLKSTSKHIYSVNETDSKIGESKEIGYCRTRAEANHLIYDWGMSKFNDHQKHRNEKKKYSVTYAYHVDDETTHFEIKERSLGYLYDGPNIVRFVIKFTKLYRSYNSILTPSELENIKKTNEGT